MGNTESVSNTPKRQRSLCVALPYYPSLTETFIRSHIERLPARIVAVHGWHPTIGDRQVLSWPRLFFYRLWRNVSGKSLGWETTAAYHKVFRKYGVEAVLAEYGETGVLVAESCKQANFPLCFHFHRYLASFPTRCAFRGRALPFTCP